jgi:hypothetical protein
MTIGPAAGFFLLAAGSADSPALTSCGAKVQCDGFLHDDTFVKVPANGWRSAMGYIGLVTPTYAYPPPVHSLGRRLR